jgi:glycosyltransferase involved in cell wall biosynthesis
MPRLKVLFITTWYPTKERPVGGVFVQEHARAVGLYDDVVVLHLSGEDPTLKEFWRIERENDDNLTKGIPTFRVWYRHFPILKVRFLYRTLKAFRSIVSNGFHPEVIHAQIYDAGIPSIFIGKIHRIPVVITEHSTAFPRRMLSKLEIMKARLAFRWADVVLPVSYALQKSIEAYGIRARFQVIPNVVDTNLFFPPVHVGEVHRPKRILFAGLLGPVKGIPYLLKALADLRHRRDDWQLDILGDGPGRIEYEHLAIELGLAKKVIFHGLKHKREVAEFMRQADLFVLPSLFETFSVVTAEALAAGIPVLATLSGGPEEFVTTEVGVLVPPGNTEALINGLDYMLSHLRMFNSDQISRYAIERFGPAQVGEQLHKVYLECIEEHKSSYGTAV